MSPVTTLFATLTGVYGGYFGAGSGVMMVAVLGFGTDLELRVVNALKTLAVLAGNLVAGAIFVVVADLDWRGDRAAGPGVGLRGVRRGAHRPPAAADPVPGAGRARRHHRRGRDAVLTVRGRRASYMSTPMNIGSPCSVSSGPSLVQAPEGTSQS